MSKRRTPNGKYEIRWKEGGRHRSRTFARSGDANAWENEISRRKQLGPLAATVIESRSTLAEFVTTDWLPHYAEPNLAENTLRRYKEIWLTHVKPRLGDYELTELTPQLLEDFLEQLQRANVGLETRRKAIMLLSGILKRAVVRQRIQVNPVQLIAKPKAPIADLAHPLAPVTVERIRDYLLTESWSSPKRGSGQSPERLRRWRHRNAMLVSLLAYQGLRPGEAITASWSQLGERTITVYASKTSRARPVKLLGPVVEDLNEWRMLCGRPTAGLIIPRHSGGAWTLWDWQNWSQRVYRKAAAAVGVTGDLRAYRLRCSFVSLLLWEGRSLTHVAEQAGHSVATLAKHYAGVIQELEEQPRVAAVDAIRQARRDVTSGRRSPLTQPQRNPGW